MRSNASFLIALVLLSALVLAPFSTTISSRAQSSSAASGYSLSSVQSYNQYGQFKVNETLTGSSNSTSLNSVTFGFPISYQSDLALLSSYARTGSSTVQTAITSSVSNDTFLITVSLEQSIGGANSTLGLVFWVLNELTPVNSSGYFEAPILDSPSISIHLNQLYSEIDFPYSTTYVSNFTSMGSHGYSQTVSGSTSQIFNYTTAKPNSTLTDFDTVLYSTPASSGALDFTTIVRQISVDASGQVMVKDTLNVHNFGLNLISLLSYSPLTNAGNLTAVPSSEPPLSNVGLIQISGGQLQLNSTNHAIQPLSSATLILEYPLSSQYWSVSNGVYTLSIPTAAPVSAVVDQYHMYSSSVSGIVVIGHAISISGTNVTQITPSTAELKFRVGIASATSNALPLAAILFVGIFVAGILFRPKEEAAEDVGSAFDDLIRVIEDKISSTNDILSELKAKSTSVNRNELVVAKSRIEDVRSKTVSRVGSIRSQIPQMVTTSVQAGLNAVVANDREYDRVVREILNNYDQVISKRMKPDTFARVQQSSERRLQNNTNTLLDSAHDLREEFESEK